MKLQFLERTIPAIDFGYLIFLCFRECSERQVRPWNWSLKHFTTASSTWQIQLCITCNHHLQGGLLCPQLWKITHRVSLRTPAIAVARLLREAIQTTGTGAPACACWLPKDGSCLTEPMPSDHFCIHCLGFSSFSFFSLNKKQFCLVLH